MPSETLARQHLVQAEDDIRKESLHIEKQKTRIEQLRSGGHSTELAEKLLRTMEQSREAFKHHRNIILEELGLYEAGESGANPGANPPSRSKDTAS
jgi:hypothetical protein